MFGNVGLLQLTEQDLQHVLDAAGLLFFGLIVGVLIAMLLNKLLGE